MVEESGAARAAPLTSRQRWGVALTALVGLLVAPVAAVTSVMSFDGGFSGSDEALWPWGWVFSAVAILGVLAGLFALAVVHRSRRALGWLAASALALWLVLTPFAEELFDHFL